jgi:hypothetical protein
MTPASVSIYIVAAFLWITMPIIIYMLSLCQRRNAINPIEENVPPPTDMDRLEQIECATVIKIVKRSSSPKKISITNNGTQDCEMGIQKNKTPEPVSVLPKVMNHQDSGISLKTCESGNVLVCLICLNDFDEGDEIRASKNTECRHIFHKECMTVWLKNKNECPICRQDFLSCSSSSIIAEALRSQSVSPSFVSLTFPL